MTVRKLLDSYMRNSASEGRHCTQAREMRERAFRQFNSVYGEMLCADLKPYHLTDWIDSHPEWKSTATKRARANAIRAAFQWAADQERIVRNPFKMIRYAEAERRPELPDEMLELILQHASKPVERALRFLRLTGCRVGELCRATWADMDLERGLWIIPRHKSRRYTHRPKVVALTDEAVSVVQFGGTAFATQVAEQAIRALPTARFPATSADKAPTVFLNLRGTPWQPRTLGLAFQRLRAKLKLDTKAGLHGIRHAMATAAIANGASIKLVGEQLGHATVVVTERYYAHRTAAMLDGMRAAAAMALAR